MIRTWIFITIVFISCNDQNQEEQKPTEPHAFYYYPKPNVYFDTLDKNFIYYDSSKNQWQPGNLPSELQRDLGKSVLIENPAQPVWTDNREHRLVYSATLYADSAKIKRQLSEPPPKKTVDQTQEKDNPPDEEEKKPSKVKEFLDKIFKKRKATNPDTI